jgi:hypothetical protein
MVGDELSPETLHLQETRGGQVNYVDPSHWQSILEDIKEVRDHLSVLNHSQSQPMFELSQASSDPSLIFGSTPSGDLDDILTSLPSQPICDLLLSSYFNSRFMILGMFIQTLGAKELVLTSKALYILSSFRKR